MRKNGSQKRKNGPRKRSATPRLSHDHEDGVEATRSREDAIAAPRQVKFIFCSGADLERADATLLDEAA